MLKINPFGRYILLIQCFLALSWNLQAEVKLPKVLASHMVLQRDQPLKIWGWAEKGEKVTVLFNGQEVSAKAARDGTWILILEAMKAGGPYNMEIKGKKNTLILKDILIGDVWVCSGQSNMEWTVSNSNNPEEEIAAADFPEIRLFDVPRNLQLAPVDDLPSGEWTECSPATVGDFSAVGYYFGRHLHRETGIPIGLIGSNWGGTVVETWISPEMSATDPEMKRGVEEIAGMDLEALQQKMEEERKKILESLGGLESGMVDGKPVWTAEDLDLSAWKNMEVPGLWEDQGLAGVDGVIWFRTNFNLSEEQASGPVELHLGAIDDNDQTWINGKLAGETKAYNKDRVYSLDAELLKTGQNTLVVRIEDTGGGGGFWGDPEKMLLVTAHGSLGLSGTWKYRVSSESFRVGTIEAVSPNSKPTLLYNGMIHPLLNYAVQGAIWYQGESNAGRAYRYRKLFPMLITDWRNQWNNPDLGFYFVQLANFRETREQPGDSDWAELREAQTQTLNLPKTGMAVIIDIGEAEDIHPRNKQDVGKRLALAALHDTYGKELVYSGPVFKSLEVKDHTVILEFDPMGSELVVKDKYGYVKGFAVAGEDREFFWARAKVKGNKVILACEEVKEAVAVRYAWADNPDDANLYNKAGLPAGPFRTDDWPGITFEK